MVAFPLKIIRTSNHHLSTICPHLFHGTVQFSPKKQKTIETERWNNARHPGPAGASVQVPNAGAMSTSGQGDDTHRGRYHHISTIMETSIW